MSKFGLVSVWFSQALTCGHVMAAAAPGILSACAFTSEKQRQISLGSPGHSEALNSQLTEPPSTAPLLAFPRTLRRGRVLRSHGEIGGVICLQREKECCFLTAGKIGAAMGWRRLTPGFRSCRCLGVWMIVREPPLESDKLLSLLFTSQRFGAIS